MYLDEFFNYKNQLIDDLLTNGEIVKLMSDKYEEMPMDEAGKLVYTQIFPYEFIPETVEHGKTFICCDVDISRMSDRREAPSNKMIYSPVLYVWLFTHKSLMRLPEGGVRVDQLAHEIAKTVNGSHKYGMGSLELYSVKRFAPAMDYQGKVMVFDAKDWNHPNPNGKPWPVNRRLGV